MVRSVAPHSCCDAYACLALLLVQAFSSSRVCILIRSQTGVLRICTFSVSSMQRYRVLAQCTRLDIMNRDCSLGMLTMLVCLNSSYANCNSRHALSFGDDLLILVRVLVLAHLMSSSCLTQWHVSGWMLLRRFDSFIDFKLYRNPHASLSDG